MKEQAFKTIDMFAWVFTCITAVSIILTVISTYQFIYIKDFNSYRGVETSITITNIAFAIKFLKDSEKKIALSFILLAIASILFMILKIS